MKVLTPNAKYTLETPDHLAGKDLLDSQNVVRECWVENVYQLNESDFDHTGIFIDIGANIGAVSLYVAAMNDNRDSSKRPIKVFAVEPEPHNLELLNRNVKGNSKVEQIRIVDKGIHSNNTSGTISNNGGNSTVLLDSDRVLDDAEEPRVELISIKTLFETYDIEECDVLKMDIEGSEYAAIEGCSIDDLKRIRYITLEFSGGSHKKEFGAMITKLAEVFNLHIIGRPSNGGYIYGRRY